MKFKYNVHFERFMNAREVLLVPGSICVLALSALSKVKILSKGSEVMGSEESVNCIFILST